MYFHRVTLKEVIANLHLQVDQSRNKNLINVIRSEVLDCASRAMKRSFDAKATLNVQFTGEDGIDEGDLTREFMALTLKGIAGLSLFAGGDEEHHVNAIAFKCNSH